MAFTRDIVARLTASRFIRFLLAGGVNTAVNFAVLNLVYYQFGQDRLVSIMVATACAIGVSFILNRSFVFGDKNKAFVKLRRFVLVSVLGVFVIQNTVFMASSYILERFIGPSTSGGKSALLINLSNVIASAAVMLWNYNGYRLFVFDTEKTTRQPIEEQSSETV